MYSSPTKAVEIRLSVYFLIFLELTSSCISQLPVTYLIGLADFYSHIQQVISFSFFKNSPKC